MLVREKRETRTIRVKPSLQNRLNIAVVKRIDAEGRNFDKSDLWEEALSEYLDKHYPEGL